MPTGGPPGYAITQLLFFTLRCISYGDQIVDDSQVGRGMDDRDLFLRKKGTEEKVSAICLSVTVEEIS
jgi:hypothetical protein